MEIQSTSIFTEWLEKLKDLKARDAIARRLQAAVILDVKVRRWSDDEHNALVRHFVHALRTFKENLISHVLKLPGCWFVFMCDCVANPVNSRQSKSKSASNKKNNAGSDTENKTHTLRGMPATLRTQ